jgi:hypothetical protein
MLQFHLALMNLLVEVEEFAPALIAIVIPAVFGIVCRSMLDRLLERIDLALKIRKLKKDFALLESIAASRVERPGFYADQLVPVSASK